MCTSCAYTLEADKDSNHVLPNTPALYKEHQPLESELKFKESSNNNVCDKLTLISHIDYGKRQTFFFSTTAATTNNNKKQNLRLTTMPSRL